MDVAGMGKKWIRVVSGLLQSLHSKTLQVQQSYGCVMVLAAACRLAKVSDNRPNKDTIAVRLARLK